MDVESATRSDRGLVEPLGAIVLCGGQSRRMGRPKAWLPIGDEVFLQRVVRLVATRASIVVVSAAPGQDLPPLPRRVEIIRDRAPDLGPLEGIAAGLDTLAGRVEWAFATAVDAPLLEPRWIDRLLELADERSDLVLPRVDGQDQPLSALYRPDVAGPAATALLASGIRTLGRLSASVRTRIVPAEALVDIDPEFRTLRNINDPEEFGTFIGPG